MNKKVVYTAIYGNKDILKDPIYVTSDFDYICFTNDTNIKSGVWKVVYEAPIHEDPVRSAKIFKAKPHDYLSEYDISLWVDANFLIYGDLNLFLEEAHNLKDTNMMLFQHDQERFCLYDEAEVVIRHQKDDIELVKRQIQKYKKEGYPPQRGLSANSIMLRKHNKNDMMALGNMWWEEISQFSRRDQLSLYYCTWKLELKHYLLKYPDMDIRSNPWFRWLPHNYEVQG